VAKLHEINVTRFLVPKRIGKIPEKAHDEMSVEKIAEKKINPGYGKRELFPMQPPGIYMNNVSKRENG